MSVLAKWSAAVVVGLLHEEPEPIEWKELHVGAERRTNCEHLHALLTNILQRHWEWQVLGFFHYQTACVASKDVKAAFDMAKPSVVCKI